MKYAVVVLSLALAIYMVIDFNSRMTDLNRLRAEKEVARGRLEGRMMTKAALEAGIAYATSDAAVLQWAYENHMVRPGDLRVVPVQSAPSTPTPTPQPVLTSTEVRNLDRWLALFLDPIPESPSP